MIKCPHYEPYYDEVERSKCLACPIKCYTFLKEEVSRLNRELEKTEKEIYERDEELGRLDVRIILLEHEVEYFRRKDKDRDFEESEE